MICLDRCLFISSIINVKMKIVVIISFLPRKKEEEDDELIEFFLIKQRTTDLSMKAKTGKYVL